MLYLSICAHVFILFDADQQTEEAVAAAARGLRQLLDPDRVLHSDLLLLISFDEAHSLTDEIKNTVPWTRFTVLSRALRSLLHEPFFAVFLSTAGKFRGVVPCTTTGTALSVFPPITAVGFDEFADRVPIDGTCTLTHLASTYHMVRLGRAL